MLKQMTPLPRLDFINVWLSLAEGSLEGLALRQDLPSMEASYDATCKMRGSMGICP